jgi:hypothetical protein
MILREISSIGNVDESTVRRWATLASGKLPEISGKMAKARETSIAADFTLPETIAIIRAGGNETLANLLAENAARKATAPSLPTAQEMRECRLLAEKGFISRQQLQVRLGFDPRYIGPGRTKARQSALPAPADDGLALLLGKTDDNGNKLGELIGNPDFVHLFSCHGIRVVGTPSKPVLAIAGRSAHFKNLIGEEPGDHTIDNYLRSHPRLIVASAQMRFACGSTRARLLALNSKEAAE